MSSFATEMNETAYILANNTERSLIIIDELGRGTSTIDAVCIAIAVVEAISETSSFCLFISHLPQVQYRSEYDRIYLYSSSILYILAKYISTVLMRLRGALYIVE